MGYRFIPNGAIFPCCVVDKKLCIHINDDIQLTWDVPFVKEDFTISHTWAISNVCMCMESNSGNLLVGWFTGDMKILKPLGQNSGYKLIAHKDFDFKNLFDEYFDRYDIGVCRSNIYIEHRYSSEYYMAEYVYKKDRRIAILDPTDAGGAIVCNIEDNPELLDLFVTGDRLRPACIRLGESIMIAATSTVLKPINTVDALDECSIIV